MVKSKINLKGLFSGLVISAVIVLLIEGLVLSSLPSFFRIVVFELGIPITPWSLIAWTILGIGSVLGEKRLFKK